MTHTATMSVDLAMSVLAQPNHPVRLAVLFGTAAACCAVVAAAVTGALYVIDDRREEQAAAPAASAAVDTPEDLIVVVPLESAQEFEDLMGFAAFLPDALPASTKQGPEFAVTTPDATGLRVGRVAYSADPDATVDGVTGPVVVIAEVQGNAGEGVDGELKRIITGARALVATLACGDLVLDVQMYYSPLPTENEPLITPWMLETSQDFVDGIKRQCAG